MSKSKKRHDFSRAEIEMRPGDNVDPRAPGHNIALIGRGRHAYVWVGNDRGCFAHVSGQARLRKFAKAILAEVGDEPKQKPAR